MSQIQKYFTIMQKYNIFSGIILIDFLATIFFLATPRPIFIPGDLAINIGVIFGLIFTYRNRKKFQNHFFIGFTTAPIGAGLASISISLMIYFSGQFISFRNFLGILFMGEIYAVAVALAFSLLFWYFDKKRRKN